MSNHGLSPPGAGETNPWLSFSGDKQTWLWEHISGQSRPAVSHLLAGRPKNSHPSFADKAQNGKHKAQKDPKKTRHWLFASGIDHLGQTFHEPHHHGGLQEGTFALFLSENVSGSGDGLQIDGSGRDGIHHGLESLLPPGHSVLLLQLGDLGKSAVGFLSKSAVVGLGNGSDHKLRVVACKGIGTTNPGIQFGVVQIHKVLSASIDEETEAK